MDNATTPEPIPSKLSNAQTHSRSISFTLLRPAKPWREEASHAYSNFNVSRFCNVLRGCRLLKLKGAG
jgi:hypothetical protein